MFFDRLTIPVGVITRPNDEKSLFTLFAYVNKCNQFFPNRVRARKTRRTRRTI